MGFTDNIKKRQLPVEPESTAPEGKFHLGNKIPERIFWQMQQMKYWGRKPIQEQLEEALAAYYALHTADADKPLPDKEREKLLSSKKPRR